jgi:hypothetical protein
MGQDDWELVPMGAPESNQDEDGQKGLEETKGKIAAYKGPESRKEVRRKGQIRREEFRFEQKSSRRSDIERRDTKSAWK